MNQTNELDCLDVREAQQPKKAWTAPTFTTAVLADITEAGLGGTYTDGSSIYARS